MQGPFGIHVYISTVFCISVQRGTWYQVDTTVWIYDRLEQQKKRVKISGKSWDTLNEQGHTDGQEHVWAFRDPCSITSICNLRNFRQLWQQQQQQQQCCHLPQAQQINALSPDNNDNIIVVITEDLFQPPPPGFRVTLISRRFYRNGKIPWLL